jgi:Uma2 family endonuclease
VLGRTPERYDDPDVEEPVPATRERRTAAVAPLESGDHLDRDEFERRYAARPDDRKCELIGGIVFVASPMRVPHASFTNLLSGWLFLYAEATPGVAPLNDATMRLGPEDEPQPDLLLRRERGGSSVVDADAYVEGPVELVIEVAHSSVALDLHAKKDRYALHGCREYLVVLVDEEEVRWFGLEGTEYRPLVASEAGWLESRVFPGLRLDPAALFLGDRAALAARLREGLAAPPHADLRERLRGEG